MSQAESKKPKFQIWRSADVLRADAWRKTGEGGATLWLFKRLRTGKSSLLFYWVNHRFVHFYHLHGPCSIAIVTIVSSQRVNVLFWRFWTCEKYVLICWRLYHIPKPVEWCEKLGQKYQALLGCMGKQSPPRIIQNATRGTKSAGTLDDW